MYRSKPGYSEYHSEYMLKRRYRITTEQWAALYISQDGVCAICEQARELIVDHCHSSGRVRGILCHNCNKALGLFGEDEDRMGKAIEYIKKGAQ